MKKFPLRIEVLEGDVLVSITDLCEMLEGSMSAEKNTRDLMLLYISNQLKELKGEGLKMDLENKKDAKNAS